MPGGMFAELLTAVTRGKKQVSGSDCDGVKLSMMRVSDLRKKLDEKGLDVDGSRESMIETLKEHSRRLYVFEALKLSAAGAAGANESELRSGCTDLSEKKN
ncbi:hypothetical protein ACHAWF_008449 [Thalassiosira exigua]